MARILLSLAPVMLFSLAACTDNKHCNRTVDDNALSELAKGMSLEEIYAFHLRNTKQCTPARTTLAWDVAGFGEPAKKLALERSNTKDLREFDAALSVIGSFNARYDKVCSPAERKLLEDRADRLSLISSLRDDVKISCTPSEADAVLNGH